MKHEKPKVVHRKLKKSGSKVISAKKFTKLSTRYSKQKGSKTIVMAGHGKQVISGRNPKKSVSRVTKPGSLPKGQLKRQRMQYGRGSA